MPLVLEEELRPGAYIISEANGTYSRETGTVLLGQVLVASQVIGIVTATGKIAKYDAGAADGTENVAGILYDNCDATEADMNKRVFSARASEVNGKEITYQEGANAAAIAVTNTGLKALGIIVR